MSYRHIDGHELVGESQPVVHLTVSPEQVATGLGFDTVGDDLDVLHRAAVQVGGLRFVLQRYDGNPAEGIEVSCYDAGDPLDQACRLVDALGLREHVDARTPRRRGIGREWVSRPVGRSSREAASHVVPAPETPSVPRSTAGAARTGPVPCGTAADVSPCSRRAARIRCVESWLRLRG